LNLEGDKISTSRNWAIWLHEYLDEMPGKEDVLRYVLTANAPETKDNDFTWRDYQARNNNELVAIYGNFVNRALVLTHKYFDGKVPPLGHLTEVDEEMLREVATIPAALDDQLEHFHFREALKTAMQLARIGNKYLADTEPWKVIKSDPDRVATILHLALQLVGNLTIAFAPFTPFSTRRLLAMLQVEEGGFAFARFGATDLLPEGHQLGKPELLFEKIEDEVIQAQLDKLATIKKLNEEQNRHPETLLEDVPFDTFIKSDMRAGRILACEKVPKADKLLRFSIDDGMGGRTIVSGIAQYYKPEELVGKTVAFVANLPVRKIRGVESQGMILSVEDYKTGQLQVVTLPDTIAPGSKLV
ncbi:class I tRNA ligase family protein, partial [Porphyromonas sp.]|uniref:class I tRNA ligase family protein n=1 Tax=Porphyromonas sp. TaxID=1924944 RepID=UPI0025D3D7F1